VNDERLLNRVNQLPPNERIGLVVDAAIVLPRATPSPPAHRHPSGSSWAWGGAWYPLLLHILLHGGI